jgi:hypothetical protein
MGAIKILVYRDEKPDPVADVFGSVLIYTDDDCSVFHNHPVSLAIQLNRAKKKEVGAWKKS